MDPKWEGPHPVGYKWDDVLYEGVTSYRDGRGLIQRWEWPHTEMGGAYTEVGVASYRDGRGLYSGGSDLILRWEGLIQRWEGPYTEVGVVSHNVVIFSSLHMT